MCMTGIVIVVDGNLMSVFRMASPERAIYRVGSLTLPFGCTQRAEYQTLKGLFPWRVTPLHKYNTHVDGGHVDDARVWWCVFKCGRLKRCVDCI